MIGTDLSVFRFDIEAAFSARWHELLAQQIDGSDESIELAFKQAHLEVFGKARKTERWVGEPMTT